MTITVEDGSIVAGANSYVTVAELFDYAAARDYDLAVSDDVAEALLIRAMDWLWSLESRYIGSRVQTTQALPFPRTGMYVDGTLLAYDEIPRNVTYAQLAKALELHNPTLYRQPAVKSERIEGAVTVEYYNPGKVYAVGAFNTAEAQINPLLRLSGLRLIRT